MQSFGELIRKTRAEKGMLLRELADKIQMDQGLLSKIERGERMPTREQVILFSKIFKTNQDDLLILYLSDKLIYELQDEKLGGKALKVAEQKFKYIKKYY